MHMHKILADRLWSARASMLRAGDGSFHRWCPIRCDHHSCVTCRCRAAKEEKDKCHVLLQTEYTNMRQSGPRLSG